MKIKRFIYSAFLLSLAGFTSVTLSGCRREANELAHHHHGHSHHDHSHAGHDHDGHDHSEHDHAHEGHDHAHDGHNHVGSKATHIHSANEISLPQHRAETLGVKTTAITPGEFLETIAVSGELTSAPSNQSTVTARSAGIVSLSSAAIPGSHVNRGQAIATVSGQGMAGGDANESARVALNAAKRELDRITPLHADGIVSTRDYNAARQAYEAAKAAAGNFSEAGSAATAPTSGTIISLLVNEGQFVSAGAPIATIAGSATLTLCANLPERNVKFLPMVSGARFRTSYSDEIYDIADFNGRRSSDLNTAVATQGYIPVYFTITNNGTLSAGSFCEIYLAGNKREGVISVPVSSLSEQQGKFFVYVRLDKDCYEKRPVVLGASSGDKVEILSGLKAGDDVVTEGTTFVRLAESSGVVPEGHSHNH